MLLTRAYWSPFIKGHSGPIKVEILQSCSERNRPGRSLSLRGTAMTTSGGRAARRDRVECVCAHSPKLRAAMRLRLRLYSWAVLVSAALLPAQEPPASGLEDMLQQARQEILNFKKGRGKNSDPAHPAEKTKCSPCGLRLRGMAQPADQEGWNVVEIAVSRSCFHNFGRTAWKRPIA